MKLPFLGPHWRLPGDDDRVSIVGKTGSGKTVMGVYLLAATRLWEKMPCVLIDYKGDKLIGAVPARDIEPDKPVPKAPGLYRLHSNPFLDKDDPVDTFLRRVWDNGETGLFFDEAYMLPDRYGRSSGTLRALFTTGRSRKIPIISLTQRPVDVTRYNFSEASHHVVFRLNDKADRDTVRARVPQADFDDAFGEGRTLPRYHSLWYDVDRDTVFRIGPCPDPREILRRFPPVEKTAWT